MQGIFFNEMYSLEMDSGKWHEVLLRYFFLEGLGEVGCLLMVAGRVTLVVAFGFLAQNFGRWRGPINVLFVII